MYKNVLKKDSLYWYSDGKAAFLANILSITLENMVIYIKIELHIRHYYLLYPKVW